MVNKLDFIPYLHEDYVIVSWHHNTSCAPIQPHTLYQMMVTMFVRNNSMSIMLLFLTNGVFSHTASGT